MTQKIMSLLCVLIAFSTGCDAPEGSVDAIEQVADEDVAFRKKRGVMGTIRLNTDMIDGMNWYIGSHRRETDDDAWDLTSIAFGTRVVDSGGFSFVGGRVYVEGQKVRPEKLIGSRWRLQTATGEVELELAEVENRTYLFLTPDGEFVCHGTDPRAWLFEGLRIDPDGDVTRDDRRLLLACLSGAAGKALDFANPLQSDEQLARYQAAIRMIRADYCGTGDSYTHEGATFIAGPPEVFDKSIEALWNDSGASCLGNLRDEAIWPDCEIPACEPGKTDDFFSSYHP